MKKDKTAFAGYGLSFLALIFLLLTIQAVNAVTFTVTNTNDSGAGSLRQAITAANSSAGVDTINFNIAGGGVKTIAPLTPLPDITFSVIIDGTTQPGWLIGNLVIELSDENLSDPTTGNGLYFFDVDENDPASVVRGLTINRFPRAGIASNVSSKITIEGCHIGTDPTGTIARGNFIGILHEALIAGAISFNNTLGGGAGEGNIIAFSGQNGVGVGSVATGNRITSNSIYSNNLLGIDLLNNGVVQVNDNLDPDTGANNLQNYPVITAANATTITGTFNSAANQQFLIQFFRVPSPDANGFGEGRFFIGEVNVTTDAGGNATFSFTPSAALPAGQLVTATATDPNGNTSEFSQAQQILAPTAANVGLQGRVLTETGRGISKAMVTLVEPSGNIRTTLTNPFGYYRFTELPAGETYVLSVSHKSYEFSPSNFIITLNEEINDFVIIGNMREPPPDLKTEDSENNSTRNN